MQDMLFISINTLIKLYVIFISLKIIFIIIRFLFPYRLKTMEQLQQQQEQFNEMIEKQQQQFKESLQQGQQKIETDYAYLEKEYNKLEAREELIKQLLKEQQKQQFKDFKDLFK